MEYPGAIFTRPLRLLMLTIFIVAFFLIAPGVILVSAGYRYDFKNGLLKETGSLSVDVQPKDATAYLDGLKIEDTVPVRLNNITPRKYTLLISAPGYYDWEKQIEISNNQTTYIKDIMLLRKDRPKQISKDRTDNLAVSADGRFLSYLTTGNNQTAVILVDQKLGTTNNVLLLPGTSALSLSFAPLSDYLVISGATAPFRQLFLVNAISPKTPVDLTALADGPIDKFIFRKTPQPEIYYSTKNGIFSYLAESNQNLTITTSTFDWYIDDGTLWKLEYSASTTNIKLIRDALGFKVNFATISVNDLQETSPLDWKLAAIYNHTALLQNSQAGKFLIVAADKKFMINANRFLVSKYSSWLILWNTSDLWTYNEGDEPFLLNRSGTPLDDVIPLDPFNTLALRWSGSLTALYPYYFIERDLIPEKIGGLTADSAARILYYSNSDGIWKMSY